jgi:glycosyltransferase involved in cell wall biosynthesis
LPRRCRFLYLSNLIPSKGALEFVQAARIVAQHEPAVEFRMYGEVRDQEFAALVDAAGTDLQSRFVRGEGIYGEAKGLAFRDSDVFVFPTYYEHETFGLVNLEAMRAGLPVIATNVGGIPDVVADGVTGEIVPPRDVPALAGAMLRFAASPDLRRRLGDAGRRRFLERFTLTSFDEAWRGALHHMARQLSST